MNMHSSAKPHEKVDYLNRCTLLRCDHSNKITGHDRIMMKQITSQAFSPAFVNMFDDDRCTSLVSHLSQCVSLLLDSHKVGLKKGNMCKKQDLLLLLLINKWQKYSQNTTIFISYEWVDHIAVYNYMFQPLSAIVRLYYFLL
jgi:hypothetical protein